MRVYGPRDIAYVRGDRDGAARLLARRSLLFHRELFEVPFRHADREACTLPQLAIFLTALASRPNLKTHASQWLDDRGWRDRLGHLGRAANDTVRYR
jgi:hypothetical protein